MSDFLSIGSEMKRLDNERPYEDRVRKILADVGLEKEAADINDHLNKSKFTLAEKTQKIDKLEQRLREVQPEMYAEEIKHWSEWHLFGRRYPSESENDEPTHNIDPVLPGYGG